MTNSIKQFKQEAAALLRRIIADVKRNGLTVDHAMAAVVLTGGLAQKDPSLGEAFEPLYAEANTRTEALGDPADADTFIDVHTKVAELIEKSALGEDDEEDIDPSDDLDKPADAHDFGMVLRQLAAATALTEAAGRQKFLGIQEIAESAVINGVTTAEALEEVYTSIKRKHPFATAESLTELANALADAIDPLGAGASARLDGSLDPEAKAALRECDALHEIIDAGTIPMDRVKALSVKTFRRVARVASETGTNLKRLISDFDELAHSAVRVGLLDHEAYHALTREAVQCEPSNFNVAKLVNAVADVIEQSATPANITQPDVTNDSAEKVVADLRANANEIAAIWQRDEDPFLFAKIGENARAGSRITDRAVALGLITSDEVNDMMIAARLSGKTPADFINAVADAVTVADVTRTNRQGTQDRHVA